MSAFDDFWYGFVESFDRLPVWLPATKMAVGDVGTIDRRGYLKQTDLRSLGVPFQLEGVTGEPPEYNFSSKGSASREVAVGADLPEQAGVAAGARLEVNFSKAGAFLVKAKGISGQRISKVLDVEREIRRLNARNAFWSKDWIYVQEVINAEQAIMLVSNSSNASATVASDAQVAGGLLAAEGRLALTDESSLMRYVVTKSRTPLMWRGRWLRGFFRPGFVDRGGDPAEPTQEAAEYEFFNHPQLFSRDPETDRQ